MLLLTSPYNLAAITDNLGEPAATPASNLGLDQPQDIYQGLGTDSTLHIDLGVARDVKVIAVLYTNAPADATWEIRAAASEAELAAGTVIFATGAFQANGQPRSDGRSHGVHIMATPQSYRWWQIKILGGSVPGGFLQLGRVVLGAGWSPLYNHSYGSSYKTASKPSLKTTESGAIIAHDLSLIPRESTHKLSWLTEDEVWGDYYNLLAEAAGVRPVLLIPDPGAAELQRQMMYGLIDVKPAIVKPHFNTFSATLTIQEMV